MTVQAPIASESRCVCFFSEKPVFYPKTARDASVAGGFGEKTIAIGLFRSAKPGIPCLLKTHLIGACKQATSQLGRHAVCWRRRAVCSLNKKPQGHLAAR